LFDRKSRRTCFVYIHGRSNFESLYLNYHHRMKMYNGVKVQRHELLASTHDGGWSAPRPGRFTRWYPLEKRLGVPWKKQNYFKESYTTNICIAWLLRLSV